MAEIETIELIDDIRKDALILMSSRPNLSYLDAYNLARENLIGKEKVTDFKFQPFTVKINTDEKKQKETFALEDDEEAITDASSSYYEEYAEKELSGIINIKDYTLDQIKAYVVAHKMGVDISLYASELYNVEQINFLAVMLASGKSIDQYLNDYNFVPKDEFAKMANEEEENFAY